MDHHVLQWLNDNTVLLLYFAHVLESHAVMADALEGGWICLVHLTGSDVYQSRTPFRHEDSISTRAFLPFNCWSALLETSCVLFVHSNSILVEWAHLVVWSHWACEVIKLWSHVKQAHCLLKIRWPTRRIFLVTITSNRSSSLLQHLSSPTAKQVRFVCSDEGR